LRTDGTDLEFIFKRLKYPRPSDVTPMHFVGWLSENYKMTIWGLDPGSTDLFVAADRSNQNAHRIRRTSTKEYYDLCGFKVANENRRIWRTEADLHQLRIIDGIPTIKTTDLQQLHRSITYRLQHVTLITSYYDLNVRFNVQKLKSYKGRQRGSSKIGRRLYLVVENTASHQVHGITIWFTLSLRQRLNGRPYQALIEAMKVNTTK
jgi:hypothetical protein